MLQNITKLLILLLLPLVLNAYESPCGLNFVPFPTAVSTTWTCVNKDVLYSNVIQYLTDNLPSFDIINKCSLGFCASDVYTDGLNDGVASIATDFALSVKGMYSGLLLYPSRSILNT